jgi:hypothetical protein
VFKTRRGFLSQSWGKRGGINRYHVQTSLKQKASPTTGGGPQIKSLALGWQCQVKNL